MRELAYQFAKIIGIRYPESWDTNQMTGRDWYFNFKKRHPDLIFRTPEQARMMRVNEFRKEDIHKFVTAVMFEIVSISEEPPKNLLPELDSIDPLELNTISIKEEPPLEIDTETIKQESNH